MLPPPTTTITALQFSLNLHLLTVPSALAATRLVLITTIPPFSLSFLSLSLSLVVRQGWTWLAAPCRRGRQLTASTVVPLRRRPLCWSRKRYRRSPPTRPSTARPRPCWAGGSRGQVHRHAPVRQPARWPTWPSPN
jgi:hypothetical protein